MHSDDTLRRAVADFFASKAACLLLTVEGAFPNRGQPRAILPGSFNPLHSGHRELAAVASRLLGRPAAFELSIENVDKPPLDEKEAFARALQFAGYADLCLTRAATFLHKARLFPGATFVVGVDTAERIISPRYYDGEAEMMTALAEIAEHGCRFLVAGRHDADGRFIVLGDLALPQAFCDLFTAIAPAEFQVNISSSALRNPQATASHHA